MNTPRIIAPRLRRGARLEPGDRNQLPAPKGHSISAVVGAGDGKDWSQLAQKLKPKQSVSGGTVPGGKAHGPGKLEDETEAARILVVLLTVQNQDEYRIEGILSGADNYIPDQPDLIHLKARIKSLLESRHRLKNGVSTTQAPADTAFTVTAPDGPNLTKAIKVVEEHMIDEDFSVERFSQLMGMSRSTLKRKLKALTGLSPQPFVQQLRLKRAARLLAAGGISISETARMVGFYDLSHFGRVFKNHFECTPSQYGQMVKASNPGPEPAENGYLGAWSGHAFEPNPSVLGRCL